MQNTQNVTVAKWNWEEVFFLLKCVMVSRGCNGEVRRLFPIVQLW